jgi:hypothetical protein
MKLLIIFVSVLLAINSVHLLQGEKVEKVPLYETPEIRRGDSVRKFFKNSL